MNGMTFNIEFKSQFGIRHPIYFLICFLWEGFRILSRIFLCDSRSGNVGSRRLREWRDILMCHFYRVVLSTHRFFCCFIC